MQLSITVSARIECGKPPDKTTSRANCGILASCTVIPKTSSSTVFGSSACFSNNPSIAWRARSSAVNFRNTVPALTNGVRAPPTTTTLLLLVIAPSPKVFGYLLAQAFDSFVCSPKRIGHKPKVDQRRHIAVAFRNLRGGRCILDHGDFKTLLQQFMQTHDSLTKKQISHAAHIKRQIEGVKNRLFSGTTLLRDP